MFAPQLDVSSEGGHTFPSVVVGTGMRASWLHESPFHAESQLHPPFGLQMPFKLHSSSV
jgi:hypothetical protein